ncbi:MAG TPA: AMP-binding protein [Methylomirabilota bacterium]
MRRKRSWATATRSRPSARCPSARPGRGDRARRSPSRASGGPSPRSTHGSHALAKGLLALGIGHGNKAALWMVNRPEWIDAMFAVMKIGAVLVPVNIRFRTKDMTYVLAQSDAPPCSSRIRW